MGPALSHVEEAVLQEYINSIPEMPAVRMALEMAFAAADSREAHWLTYRLLWAMPWPDTLVPADAAAARAIGVRHAFRSLADTWIAWASKWTQTFGASWADFGPASMRETSPTELPHHGQLEAQSTHLSLSLPMLRAPWIPVLSAHRPVPSQSQPSEA